jgi:hypothetical protein
MSDAMGFLLGGSVPSAKFDTAGTTVGGPITEEPELRQQIDYDTDEPAVWKDGKPKMQLVVTVQTNLRDPQNPDDDGTRRFYVRSNLQKAVAQAVRQAGAKSLEVGGVLNVTYTGDGPKTNPKFNAPKLYSATYTPPAEGFLAAPVAEEAAPVAAAPAAEQIPAGFTPEVWAAMTPEAKAALAALQK